MSLLAKTRTGSLAFVGEITYRSQDPETEIELDARSVRRLTGDNRWRAIVCREGRVWITQERDLKDYVLSAGEIFLVTRPGTVIIQALTDTRIEITSSLVSASNVRRFADTVFP